MNIRNDPLIGTWNHMIDKCIASNGLLSFQIFQTCKYQNFNKLLSGCTKDITREQLKTSCIIRDLAITKHLKFMVKQQTTMPMLQHWLDKIIQYSVTCHPRERWHQSHNLQGQEF